MASTPTMASEVYHLPDYEIEDHADILEKCCDIAGAAILRDYVRLRKLNGELCKCVNDAVLQNCALCKSKNTVACDTDGFCSERKWKKILAEAKKGETK